MARNPLFKKKIKTSFPVYLFQEKDAQNPNHFIVWQRWKSLSFSCHPLFIQDAKAKAFVELSVCKLVQELEVGLALGCSCWNEVATRVGKSDGSIETATQLHTLLRGDDAVSVPKDMEGRQ